MRDIQHAMKSALTISWLPYSFCDCQTLSDCKYSSSSKWVEIFVFECLWKRARQNLCSLFEKGRGGGGWVCINVPYVCVCIHPSISPVVGWGGGEMFYRSVTVPAVCWKDLGFPGDWVGQTTLEAVVSFQLNPNPYKSHHLCPGFQTVSQGCVCNWPELDLSKHLNI